MNTFSEVRFLGTRSVDATPNASSLIEGQRDFGYNLQTAVADIVDNSISAEATQIELISNTEADEPFIALADNGRGMTEIELIEAMRLGSKNPMDERNPEDLGRFGLGLKSASFSQCRKLTVITRHQGVTACARWDLDKIAKRNDWILDLIDNPQNVLGHEFLGESGTVVVWENLDRLTGGFDKQSQKRAEHTNSELAATEYHLRLVFHRFLEGYNPRLNLFLNKRLLKPIDPLASAHPSTQKDPEETLQLRRGDVKIQCHTLPHHKRMTSEEWDEIGGPDGHLKSQGLYIYRENRLIISGGWLGLTRQTELTKLCRIAINIKNTMDSEWKIDVKKASAQLPPTVKARLKIVIERFLGTSKRTYHGRGKKLVDETRFPVWNRIQKDGLIVFKPDLNHPVFLAYSKQLPENLKEGFDTCLRLVGASLPIDTLHAELAGNAEAVGVDKPDDQDIEKIVYAMADTFLENGLPQDALFETMQSHPLLKAHWDVVSKILEKIVQGSPE